MLLAPDFSGLTGQADYPLFSRTGICPFQESQPFRTVPRCFGSRYEIWGRYGKDKPPMSLNYGHRFVKMKRFTLVSDFYGEINGVVLGFIQAGQRSRAAF
jgi:hypothetical protein